MRPIVVRSADVGEIARIWGVLRQVRRQRAGTEVLLDVSRITGVSAAFEAFFLALDRQASARGLVVKAVDPAGVLAPIRARYDFASYGLSAPAGRRRRSFCGAVGEGVCALFENARFNFAFLGETAATALGMLVHPRRFRFGDAALAFERAGFDGLLITALIGLLLGLILAFQSAAALEMFGVEVYVADLITLALFRELGPLITAIILAGRSGSAFAAEIGTMKVDEELDALTTFGLSPVRFLVPPRVVAAALAMPVLTIVAELCGLFGGALALRLGMHIPYVVFWNHAVKAASFKIIVLGLSKSLLFGALVGLIGCVCGMRTRNTADGVGVAATNAVVGGIVAIAVTDGLLAVICYILHI